MYSHYFMNAAADHATTGLTLGQSAGLLARFISEAYKMGGEL